jgi:hypothetical protein
LQLAWILLLGLYLVNLGYGFEGSFRKLADFDFVSSTLGGDPQSAQESPRPRNRFTRSCLGAVPVPLPANYLLGIDYQKYDFERKMWSYSRGRWRKGGWWYYYLYALAIKVPLGTWILLLVAFAAGLGRPGCLARWQDELLLLAPALAVLTLVSSQTGFSHHLRYVLPIFPFFFIWMSKVVLALNLRNGKTAAFAAVALLWSLTSSLWVYPHSLAYFNELAGGPKGGHAHLLGSNLDWDQDLLYLKRWLDAHPQARPLRAALGGGHSPRLLGIEPASPPLGPNFSRRSADLVPSRLGPQPGWHALGVNQIHKRTRDYAYFLRFEPVATAGYSIYIYHITAGEANCLSWGT